MGNQGRKFYLLWARWNIYLRARQLTCSWRYFCTYTVIRLITKATQLICTFYQGNLKRVNNKFGGDQSNVVHKRMAITPLLRLVFCLTSVVNTSEFFEVSLHNSILEFWSFYYLWCVLIAYGTYQRFNSLGQTPMEIRFCFSVTQIEIPWTKCTLILSSAFMYQNIELT